MNAVVALFLALAALIVGVILGWWLAGRNVAGLTSERDQARADADGWRLKFNEAVVNLAGEAEKNCPVSKVLNAEITLDAKLA